MSLQAFRAEFPILDEDQPISAVKATAAVEFLRLAKDQDVLIVGDIAWAIDGPMLVGIASARPPQWVQQIRPRAEWSKVSRRSDEIVALHEKGYTFEQIGELIGCTRSAAAKAAQRHREAA